MMTIVRSIVNIIGSMCLVHEHETCHFDSEQDIHMSCKFYEESVYGLDLDLLTILY